MSFLLSKEKVDWIYIVRIHTWDHEILDILVRLDGYRMKKPLSQGLTFTAYKYCVYVYVYQNGLYAFCCCCCCCCFCWVNGLWYLLYLQIPPYHYNFLMIFNNNMCLRLSKKEKNLIAKISWKSNNIFARNCAKITTFFLR